VMALPRRDDNSQLTNVITLACRLLPSVKVR